MIKAYSALEAKTLLQGRFRFDVYDKDGKWLRGEVTPNAVCLAALTDLLSVYLGAGTQKTLWYLLLINNTPTPTLSTSDTAASHAGWTEFTNYTQATRQAWTPSAASGQAITNPTAATFTMDTGGGAVYGAALISVSTKSSTSGIIWATGAFPSVQTLSVGQNVTVNYTSTAAGS